MSSSLSKPSASPGFPFSNARVATRVVNYCIDIFLCLWFQRYAFRYCACGWANHMREVDTIFGPKRDFEPPKTSKEKTTEKKREDIWASSQEHYRLKHRYIYITSKTSASCVFLCTTVCCRCVSLLSSVDRQEQVIFAHTHKEKFTG